MTVVFAEHECVCEHPPSAHDDGFGCTERGCDCLAGWLIGQEGPDVGRALAAADPAAVLAALGAKVSPDLDAYASGRLPLSRVRCVLCGAAPCRCQQCAAPYLRYLADAPEPCGMTVGPDGQCPRGHRQDGGAR